jgi:hypothetical protein
MGSGELPEYVHSVHEPAESTGTIIGDLLADPAMKSRSGASIDMWQSRRGPMAPFLFLLIPASPSSRSVSLNIGTGSGELAMRTGPASGVR